MPGVELAAAQRSSDPAIEVGVEIGRDEGIASRHQQLHRDIRASGPAREQAPQDIGAIDRGTARSIAGQGRGGMTGPGRDPVETGQHPRPVARQPQPPGQLRSAGWQPGDHVPGPAHLPQQLAQVARRRAPQTATGPGADVLEARSRDGGEGRDPSARPLARDRRPALHRAPIVSDQVNGAARAGGVDHREHVGDEPIEAVRPTSPRRARAAHAAHVVGDHPEALAEQLDDLVPDRPGIGVAVHEQDHRGVRRPALADGEIDPG